MCMLLEYRSDQRRRALNAQQKARRPNSAATTASEQEIEQEKLELAALQELGLPSSFNVSKSVSSIYLLKVHTIPTRLALAN